MVARFILSFPFFSPPERGIVVAVRFGGVALSFDGPPLVASVNCLCNSFSLLLCSS